MGSTVYKHIGGSLTRAFRVKPRNVIVYVTIRFPIGHFLLMVLWNHASISNGFLGYTFKGKCVALVHATNFKVIHFDTNRFLIYDFL